MNPMKKMMADAAALDSRRQHQIRNQVEAINRLMAGGTYDEEMAKLHLMLAGAQHYVEFLHELLRENNIATPAAESCGICGNPVDHFGVPHSVATGDGRTRADVAAAPTEPTD